MKSINTSFNTPSPTTTPSAKRSPRRIKISAKKMNKPFLDDPISSLIADAFQTKIPNKWSGLYLPISFNSMGELQSGSSKFAIKYTKT